MGDDWGMDGAPLTEADNLELGEDELEGSPFHGRVPLPGRASQTLASRRAVGHGGGGVRANLALHLAGLAEAGAGAPEGARGTAAR